MSEADELLNSMSDEASRSMDSVILNVTKLGQGILGFNSSEPHIVINSDRTIAVPEELKRIAVQHDHNIETVTFDCPRYWDGRDLSTMKIYVNYKTPDNRLGSYIVDNIKVDATNNGIMHFDWTIEADVTRTNGQLSILICAKRTDDEGLEVNHWNSELNKEMFVSEGLDCEDSVIDNYPSIITQLLTRMQVVEDLPPTVQVEDIAHGHRITMTDIHGSTSIEVINGAVYIPTVSSDGTISWTNDQGLPNPDPVRVEMPEDYWYATSEEVSSIFQSTVGGGILNTHKLGQFILGGI